MFVASLLLSAAFLYVVNDMARKGKSGKYSVGLYRVGILSVLTVFLGGCAFSLALPVQALFVMIAASICYYHSEGKRLFLKYSLAVTFIAYLVFAAFQVPELLEWARLKERYPYESLSERLAYENKPRLIAQPLQESTASLSESGHISKIAARDLGKWENLERMIDGDGLLGNRTLSLEHLHAGVVKQFIESPGFGPIRMLDRAAPRYLEIREHQPIPLLSWEKEYIPESARKLPASIGLVDPPSNVPQVKEFFDMHARNALNFANPMGFGYVKDLEHVAGFQAHQFHHGQSWNDSPSKEVSERWKIERLELVSILKFEEPAVYVADHLPRMDDLRHAKTRPLNDFEADALAALRRGEDMKIQAASDRILMLGSLRAVKQCVRCHQVERGDLLGAFSYRFRLEPTDARGNDVKK